MGGFFFILPEQGSRELYHCDIYELHINHNFGVISSDCSSDKIYELELDLKCEKLLNFKETNLVIVTKEEKEKIILHNTRAINSTDKPMIKHIEIPKDTVSIDEMTWNLLISAVQLKKYPLLIGPKGTGKTMTCKAIASALKMDYYKLNCGSLFKPTKSLIGTLQASQGSTYLIQSEFLKFYTSSKPTLIMLDELNRIPTMAANYMMNILEQEDSYIYSEEEGKRHYKGENVTFIAACNFGIEYVDTRSLDGAFADRFLKMTINYLSEDDEVELICKRIKGVEKKNVRKLVQKANSIRSQVEEEVFQTGVSTRQLLDMCTFLQKGFSVYEITKYIFRNIFLTSNSKEEVEMFDKIMNAES